MENQANKNNTDDSTRLKQLEERIKQLEVIVGKELGCVHKWDEKLMNESSEVIYKRCGICGSIQI